MPPGVFALVIVAAFLHVAWNAMLKVSGDPLRTSLRSNVAGVLVFAPIVLAGWIAIGRPGIPAEVAALGVLSGLLEAAYFVSLSAAYKRGDLSVVYPIARGTAPLLAVLLGVLVLGERLGPIGAIGVATLLAGILIVQQPWRAIAAVRGGGGRLSAGAAEFAMLTGATIAAYSAVDRVAAQQVALWLYAAIVFPVCSVVLIGWVTLVADRRRPGQDEAPTPQPASWTGAGLLGTLSLGTYGLVLLAYALAPLTAVAPLRESAVVIASAWGAIRMGEAVTARDRTQRIGGAVLVLVGAVLLALEG